MLGSYWGNGKEMETTVVPWDNTRDNGKENGNYRDYSDHIGFI